MALADLCECREDRACGIVVGVSEFGGARGESSCNQDRSEDRDRRCTAQREARAVEAELGPGRYIRRGGWAGYYAYRSGSITVFVGYGAGRTDAIDTRSRAALVYQHPLREGLAKLKPILIAHGWKVLSCQGETFTDLGQGGPGTGIAWRKGKLDFVQIDAGGSVGDACLPL